MLRRSLAVLVRSGYQRLGMRIVLVPAAVTTRITYIPGARCATDRKSVV